MIPNPVRVRAVAAEAVGAFYPTLLGLVQDCSWAWSLPARKQGQRWHWDEFFDLFCQTSKPSAKWQEIKRHPQDMSHVKGWSNSICDCHSFLFPRCMKDFVPLRSMVPHVISNLHLHLFRRSLVPILLGPASVVLVNDALQLFLALFAVSLRVGLSSLFYDGSLVSRLGWRRRTENG